jgi:hypothetical protein
LAQALHLTLVPHTTCAEHGELVHDGSPFDGGSAATEIAYASAHPTEIASAPNDDGEHEHEHCLVTAPRQLTVAGITVPVLSSSWNFVDEVFVPTSAALGRDVIAFAPKTSPPVLS